MKKAIRYAEPCLYWVGFVGGLLTMLHILN